MKRSAIVKRIVSGLFGTVALTSFILFALDAYRANQAASHTALQADSATAGHTALQNKTALHAKDENLSIGTSERHMLFQSEDASSSQSSSATPSDTQTPDLQKNTDSDVQIRNLQKETDPDARIHKSQKDDDSDIQLHASIQNEDSDASDQIVQNKSSYGSQKQDIQKDSSSEKKHPAFCTVSEDYFSDALFIGDSRTVGMLQSHLLPGAAYYAKTGIGIGTILSERIVNEGGRMISVCDALSLHSFGKVYIMIGINDISAGDTDWFVKQYREILRTVRQTQPDAVIYIQGNIPMSYGTQDLSGALNNQNLSRRNEASRALADKETIFYLDISSIYADENGNLKSHYTSDGLHVMPDYYPLWVDYLLHHAVIMD